MKRSVTIAVSVLLAIQVLLPAGTALAGVNPTVYLALGDSLAVGIGASVPARNGYVARLAGFFHGTPHGGAHVLTNLARGGETSSTFVSGGQLASALTEINKPTDVRVVMLDIGGDDLLPLLLSPPCAVDPNSADCQAAVAARLGSFAANYLFILTALTVALASDPGDERVLVMSYYNPFSGTGSLLEAPVDRVLLGSDSTIDCAANAADPRKAGLNDLITCIGRGFGVTAVDVYPLFKDKGLSLTHIAQRDIHPTDHGYATIAQAFRRAVKDH